jgi:hypothetical protein
LQNKGGSFKQPHVSFETSKKKLEISSNMHAAARLKAQLLQVLKIARTCHHCISAYLKSSDIK